ncbi:MAG: tetratricopeptide repeat protein [Gammaproteobacteria bacterium]|nr:tetratricopeptide repeat protein [Gammaproteobacteria bacterium]
MDGQALKSLQAAASSFSRGRLDDAAQLCNKVVASYPESVEALHLLALINRRKGDFTEAERLFRDCLALAPRRADIRANLGNLLVAGGLLPDAIDEYRQALQCDPAFRPARIALARQLNATGQHDAALAEATQLTEADAKDAEAWVARGVALRAKNELDEAEEAYRMAIRLKPDYAVAHHNLGALLAQTSRSEEALDELDKSESLGVRGPELAYNRASALMGTFEFDAAEKTLVDSIHAGRPSLESLRMLARLRYMRGSDDYVDEFRDAIAAAPDDVSLRVGLGQILSAAGQLDEAEAVFLEARDRNPSFAPVFTGLAGVYQEAGEFEKAVQNARAGAAAAPQDDQPTDMMIDALLSLGEAQEAMTLIAPKRVQHPFNQYYIATEATAARLLGDPRYEYLYDYERLVRPYELEAPAGWSSMQAFQEDLIPKLNERHRFHAQPLDQSLRAGTQTPRGLLADPDPVIKAFIGALSAPIEQYREQIGFDEKHPMRSRNRGSTHMTGCWSVRLRRGGYHVNHVHSEGWLSSAYYVSVPPEVQDSDAKSGWIKFGEPRYPVPGATAEKYVQPHAGMLVLFPSYMWHGTMPIHGDEPRMTIAFDAVTASKG